ncbi:type IV pilin biogenesis protein [Pseudobythopirellula maris]|uniref:Type IV pilin biogenesis protein n=2 Tax=Pseudobythopirellula maris TaxID=2527991 RepID=A0A5C5ZT28_9BACT|nr:type IV pilin biogenesis protein [Pseudobythopirellula maris]
MLLAIAHGLAIQVGLRFANGARGAHSWGLMGSFLRFISWTLLFLAGCAIVGMTFWAVFPLVIMAISSLEMLIARREQQRRDSWSVVAHAAAAGRPVESAMRENLGRYRGLVGRSVRRFVQSLAAGTPLAEAIGKHPRAFPMRAQGYASLSTHGGLPLAAMTATADPPGSEALAWSLCRRFAYFAWLALVVVAVVTFIMVAIVPAFRKIFIDFDLELPGVSRTLIAMSEQAIGSYFAALLGWLTALFTFIGIVLFFCYLFDNPVLARATDWLFAAWRRAEVLRLLAAVIDHRMPLPDGIGRLAFGAPRLPYKRFTKRLQHCYAALNRGDDWLDAMLEQKLVRASDAEVLRAAERAGNLPWALRSVADRGVERAAYRWEARQQAALVIATVIFALFVGLVCVALFLPLVSLIEGLV